MLSDAFGLESNPFDGSLDPLSFYMGGPQREAIARIEWLLESRHRFGILTGDTGVGKSHLASMAVRRLGALSAETVLLPVRGLGEGDWLPMLLDRLPLEPESREEPLRPWQKLDDRLQENTLMERPTAIILDDVDLAPADCLEGMARLVTSPEARHAGLLVVATTRHAGLARMPKDRPSRAGVRVELTAWEEADVAGFIQSAVRRAGIERELFQEPAIGTLARLAGGVPRLVVKLAGLSLVAAAGEGLNVVDSARVEKAWRELAAESESVGGGEGLVTGRVQAPARVRPVRRLWG
ncbi:MAG: ExeA family protein [Planctomycetaceae bacterium]